MTSVDYPSPFGLLHFQLTSPSARTQQLHLQFIIHGRACRDCTALGVTAAKPVAVCPLKPFLDGRRPAVVTDAEEEKEEDKPASKQKRRSTSNEESTATAGAKRSRKMGA